MSEAIPDGGRDEGPAADDVPTGEAGQADLLAELADDFARRLRNGERPSVDACAAANPALAGQIRDLFPALVAIEQSGPDPTPAAERVGAVVGGRYKLLERLGEGGFGVVYMAEQLRPVRRRVAVKVIKPGLDTRQVIARFEAERQALALMEHENIARVLDGGATDSGRPYFVMELVRGVPITRYCDEHRLSPRERLGLFIQVCRAVQHAHTKGIIHRDLKPTNILVTSHDGVAVPKVIDFGVAKATGQQLLTERTLFTQFAQMVGTPLYMSPEQAELSGLDVDTRSDVYSLGVLLYELLTGTTPFDKQRLAKAAYDEVRRIIREEEPPRPSTRLSTLGETLASVSAQRHTDPKHLGQIVRGELDWIVMRALEKDRTRRYETANGLARDVERYLADEAVEACPPSRLYRVRKVVRRNKVALATGSLVAGVLVIATVVSTWQAVRARAEKRRADEQTAIAKAVNDFLNRDVLGQASAFNQGAPGVAPDRDLKLRDALDRASQRIDTQFRDEPLVEAAVRYAIGDAYHEIGAYDKAQPHLEAAYRIRQQVLGERDPDTLECAHNLTVLYRRQGQYDRADALLRHSLEIARQSLGERHAVTLGLLLASGAFELERGHFARAEPLVRDAVEGMKRTLGEEDRRSLEALRIFGSVYLGAGALDKAKRVLVRALEGHRRRLGDDHPGTLETMNELALVYISLGDPDAAIALLRPALQGIEKGVGREHTDRTTMLCNLALAYMDKGNYGEAENLLVPLLNEQREGHTDTLKVSGMLAELYLRRDDYKKAKPLAQEAWEGYRELLGDKHPDTIAELGHLAHAHAGLGELREAETRWGDALKASVEVHGEASRPTVMILSSLGVLYADRRQFDVAERTLVRAISAAQQCPPPRDPLVEGAMSELAQLYIARERYPDAEPLLRQVAALRGGKDDDVLADLGNVLLAQEKWPEAETVWRDCLTVRQRTLPAGSAKITSSMGAVGWALLKQGSYDQAEPFLLTAYRELTAHPPPEREASRTLNALEMIVELYTAWGHAGEAAAWRAKRPAATTAATGPSGGS